MQQNRYCLNETATENNSFDNNKDPNYLITLHEVEVIISSKSKLWLISECVNMINVKTIKVGGMNDFCNLFHLRLM